MVFMANLYNGLLVHMYIIIFFISCIVPISINAHLAIYVLEIDFEVWLSYYIYMAVYFLYMPLLLGIFIPLWCHSDLGNYWTYHLRFYLTYIFCIYTAGNISFSYISSIKLYSNKWFSLTTFLKMAGNIYSLRFIEYNQVSFIRVTM